VDRVIMFDQPPTRPMAAVPGPVSPTEGRHRHPESPTTVCKCQAPAPCWEHPDDRPLIKGEPAWNAAAPDSPVGRLRRRSEPGGVFMVVEARERLPLYDDDDLAVLAQLVNAEMARRQQRQAGEAS
jgi:hypothetical protein